MKEIYIERLTRLIEKCEDISLLDLIERILMKSNEG